MTGLIVTQEAEAAFLAETKSIDGNLRLGWVLGVCQDDGSECCALSLLRVPEGTQPAEAAYPGLLSKTLPLLPAGIRILGAFAAGSGAQEAAFTVADGCPPLPCGKVLVALAETGGDELPSLSFKWKLQNGEMQDAGISSDKAKPAAEALASGYVCIGCRLPLHCHILEASGRTWQEAVEDAVEGLASDLIASQMVFVLRDTAQASGSGVSSASKGGKKSSSGVAKQQVASGGAVLKLGWSSVDGTVGNLLGAAGQAGARAVEATVLVQAAGEGEEKGASAPMAQYHILEETQGAVSVRPARFHLNLLAFIPRGAAAAGVVEGTLLPGLLAQLRACGEALKKQEGCEWVKVYQFELDNIPFPAAAAYLLPKAGDGSPAGCEKIDTDNLSARRAIHSALGLPMDRPLLRVANAMRSGSSTAAVTTASAPSSSRLENVHVGLPPSGVNGTVTTIWGNYDYYHYMQDRFDDNGWGCAYRSLQTIMSWFRKQHYTSKPVLTHREIQQTLVDLGDKTSKFVGSREWIGAIELSYILDTHMGVTCKVMTVSAGSEMPSKAREIAQHFETQGTPIMIGGGVLAYTLLGIDYNESTGDAAFLILDPHYTGGEDLKRIHSGTWVWWKKPGDKAAAGGELFVRDAFYNLLCPQRPREI